MRGGVEVGGGGSHRETESPAPRQRMLCLWLPPRLVSAYTKWHNRHNMMTKWRHVNHRKEFSPESINHSAFIVWTLLRTIEMKTKHVFRGLFYTCSNPLGLKIDPHFAWQKTWNGYFLTWCPLTGRDQVFPLRSWKVETRESFSADLVLHILLHTQQKHWKKKKEKGKSRADLPEWLVLISRWTSHNCLCLRSHAQILWQRCKIEVRKKKEEGRLSLNFCLYVNPHEHLDPAAAVSSAGKCTGKKKKLWNCIWDTPALSRSAGLWKSSLFSLAVFRKSHRASQWMQPEQKAGFALLTPLCFHSFNFATTRSSVAVLIKDTLASFGDSPFRGKTRGETRPQHDPLRIHWL